MPPGLIIILEAAGAALAVALLCKLRSRDTRAARLAAWWQSEGWPIAMIAFMVLAFWLDKSPPDPDAMPQRP